MSIVDDEKQPEVDNQGRIVQAEPAPAPEVPDKLKGKSMEEVYDMYLHAEKDRSRIANELGEQRKLTDKALSLSQPETAQEEMEEALSLDPTDLLADPVQTLDKYFESREARIRSQYDSRIQQLESTIGQQSLAAKHPDAEQLTNDPEFLAWVASEPVRQQLANQAVSNTDYGALDYLLSEYKGHQVVPEPAPQVDRKAAARAASFEGSSSGESASSGEIYSRNALIQMKIDNPEGYADPAFQAEIIKAYAEGRVK